MSTQVERCRRRWIRRAVNRCLVILIGTAVICTSINVYADHKLQQNLDDVKQQQTDTLNTLMYHRISTEPELNPITGLQTSSSTLNQNDCELITRVVMSESNTYEGMMAVAQVIQNRASLWDMSPYDVVTQKGQFAKPYTGELSAEAVQAVSAVFDEGQKAFESNATHFHSLDITEPYWTKNKQYVGKSGGNKFWI